MKKTMEMTATMMKELDAMNEVIAEAIRYSTDEDESMVTFMAQSITNRVAEWMRSCPQLSYDEVISNLKRYDEDTRCIDWNYIMHLNKEEVEFLNVFYSKNVHKFLELHPEVAELIKLPSDVASSKQSIERYIKIIQKFAEPMSESNFWI